MLNSGKDGSNTGCEFGANFIEEPVELDTDVWVGSHLAEIRGGGILYRQRNGRSKGLGAGISMLTQKVSETPVERGVSI